jgi:hypothetical protein
MLPRRRETKLKRKNESDREIRKSGRTNRNKQWDKKARTLQSNRVRLRTAKVKVKYIQE